MRRLAAAAAVVLLCVLAATAIGKNRLQRLAVNAQGSLAIALAHPSAETISRSRERARLDDWTTFAHDQQLTGLETRDTGITPATVAHLTLRWARPLHEKTVASPLAAGGRVYVATSEGSVIALDAASGAVLWHVTVGNTVHMTPALDGDRLLVGVYGQFGRSGQQPRGASFLALDTATGKILWRTPLPGLIRSEPVIVGSTIYEGLAGGDEFSGCFNGRIVALDRATGKQKAPTWFVVGGPRGGGGIWSPLSTREGQLYVGTGNSCGELGRTGYGDSIVALDTRDLRVRWKVSAFVPGVDDSDVGGGFMLLGNRGYIAGKSGYLYVIDTVTGRLTARFDLKPYARNGGSIGTPTTDGDVIVISSGELHNPWEDTRSMTNAGGDLVALDAAAHERYRLHSDYAIHGYAAFVHGVGFAALDRYLVGFDSRSGAILWKAPIDDVAYPSPIVVPSGVYQVTNAGTVFAYGFP